MMGLDAGALILLALILGWLAVTHYIDGRRLLAHRREIKRLREEFYGRDDTKKEPAP